MTKILASAPNLDELKKLIAEYYFTIPENIKFGDFGTIFKNEKQTNTKYEIKRGRARFILILG